jgi:hypothetical protein
MAAIILLGARLLGVSPAVAKVITIMLAIAAALSAAWGGYELIKHRGAEEVREQIQKENQNAIRKGGDAGRSFDDCLAAGGVYDFARQRCRDVPRSDR